MTSPTNTRAGTRQQSSAAHTLILYYYTNKDTNENLKEHQPSEEAHSTSLASDPMEPKSYKQALLSNEKDEWTKSIKAEIENFYSRKEWKLNPRKNLNGRKPVGAKWVFKKKNEHDNTTRYKGRIAVKGYLWMTMRLLAFLPGVLRRTRNALLSLDLFRPVGGRAIPSTREFA